MVSRALREERDQESGEVEETHEFYDGDILDFLDMGNIVEYLYEADKKAAKILDDYDAALNTMSDWKESYDKALKLAKLEPKAKKKTFPFEGASTAMLPFIMEAMLDFNSRAAPELAFAKKIVATKISGKKTPEKEARADRVSDYQNYQLGEAMPQWRDEQDKNMLILPCIGTTYKKTYYDYDEKEVRSDLCLADEIVFNHDYKSFEQAPDKYEEKSYTKNEIIGFIRGEQDWEIDEDTLDDDEKDNEKFIEAYTWCDQDVDGLEEPYCIVVRKKDSKAVYMRPLFDEDTILYNDENEIIKAEMIHIFTQYRFMPDPAGGPMGMGWGILLGSMFKSINTNLRQQIDAGTLATTSANSGLINMDMTSKRGNSVQSGPIKVKMGQLTPIQNRGAGSLSQNVVQFPFAGPNPSMFQLLEYLTRSARSMIVASADIEANPGEAQGLYLARLQQGLKQPNVIIMRVYECAKRELKAIGLENWKHYDDGKYERVIEEQGSMEKDFNPEDCDIQLIADPSQGSDMERAARANIVLEEAKTQPAQVLNLREAYLKWLKVLQVTDEEIELLAPEPEPGPSPQEKMLIAQQQMEAEFRQRDQQLREQEQKLKAARLQVEQAKQATETAKQMAEAGIKADKTEAEVAKLYSEALKNLYEIGVSNPIQAVQQIENKFLTKTEGGQNGSSEAATPASNQVPDRTMGIQPSNQSVS